MAKKKKGPQKRVPSQSGGKRKSSGRRKAAAKPTPKVVPPILPVPMGNVHIFIFKGETIMSSAPTAPAQPQAGAPSPGRDDQQDVQIALILQELIPGLHEQIGRVLTIVNQGQNVDAAILDRLGSGQGADPKLIEEARKKFDSMRKAIDESEKTQKALMQKLNP